MGNNRDNTTGGKLSYGKGGVGADTTWSWSHVDDTLSPVVSGSVEKTGIEILWKFLSAVRLLDTLDILSGDKLTMGVEDSNFWRGECKGSWVEVVSGFGK